MIRLFKQSTLGQILVIFLTAVLLWAKAFIVPVELSTVNFFSPLYEIVYGWLSGLPRLASAIALLLTLCEGAWLNIILTDHKLTKANSLMPMLLYVVAMSWNYSQLTVTPILIVNILVLVCCKQLLSNGNITLSVEHNFNASFCIGLMALCYLPALCYIVPFLFVFVIYKLYRWRDIVISIFGLIAPSIILFTYAFLCDKLDYYLILIWHDLVNVHPKLESFSFWVMLPTMVFLLILIAALFKQLGSLSDRIVHQRINTGIITLPLLAAVLLLLYTQIIPMNTQGFAIPFCFLATRFLMVDRKRKWISESLLWIILICAVTNVLIQ